MTKRIKTILIAAVVFALSVNAFAQAPAGSIVERHGALKVEGNKIIGTKSGEPVVFRGMSFFWTTAGWGAEHFYTAGAVNTLVDDWKATVVRAAMDPNSRGNWKTVIDQARARGIYAVIDWHTHDHNTRSAAVTFFTEQANAYKNDPSVIFEIFNEPCSGNAVGGGSCGGDNWNTQIKPYAVAVINAIRATGANNLIVIGSPDYSKLQGTGGSVITNPITGADLSNASYANNLVYSVHYYTAEPGTMHQSGLRSVCGNALSAGLALMVTEWGLSEADGGQNNTSKIDTDEAERWFEFLDKNHISWMNWSIHTKNEAASALSSGNGDGTNWQTRPSGTFIRNALRKYDEARTLTITTVPASGGGTIQGTKSSYKYGDFITLKAVPAPGYEFVGWSGTGSISPPSDRTLREFYLTSNMSATATFTAAGNLVTNGTFNGVSGWTVQRTDGGAATLAENTGGGGLVSVTATGTVIIRQNVSLTKCTRYRLSFDARVVSGSRTVTAFVGAYDTIRADLTTTSKSFTSEFDMTGNSGNVILGFNCGDKTGDWIINNVRLESIGDVTNCNTSTTSLPAPASRAKWSLSHTAGALTFRGPVEHGSRVVVYDTRGKAVRTFAAKDGLTLGKNLPAGNYLVVVKNAAGREVFRSRAAMVR